MIDKYTGIIAAMKLNLILVIIISFLLTPFAEAAGVTEFACDNADVDSLEEVCVVRLDYKFSQCQLSFQVGTAVLSDFDIILQHEYGKGNADIGSITEYTASGDYTTPAGYLYYASTDLTTANTSDTHSLILDHLATVRGFTISAAGTSSVFTGRVICNDL